MRKTRSTSVVALGAVVVLCALAAAAPLLSGAYQVSGYANGTMFIPPGPPSTGFVDTLEFGHAVLEWSPALDKYLVHEGDLGGPIMADVMFTEDEVPPGYDYKWTGASYYHGSGNGSGAVYIP